ncbi:MAG TPA: MarR family transcriptional regulator [Streptosporangiaceae bacterium]|jgi:DNA-binding MarR family transcriptional regulator|nr:MarR family transcriptional regulator [Streptosporangiaceae bacterium]
MDDLREEQLAAVLLRLSFLVQRGYLDVSRRHELTPQQAQLLCMLLGGPVGMAELGGWLHLEKSSMTGLVDRAERRGLVARVPDARDRRACQVALTEQGTELATRFYDHVSRSLAALADELHPADRRRLAQSINQILTLHGVPVADLSAPDAPGERTGPTPPR